MPGASDVVRPYWKSHQKKWQRREIRLSVDPQSCAVITIMNLRMWPHSNKTSCDNMQSLPHLLSAPPAPGEALTQFMSLGICLFWTFPINGIRQHVVSCDWHLSLSIWFPRHIHVVLCVSTPFLSKAE